MIAHYMYVKRLVEQWRNESDQHEQEEPFEGVKTNTWIGKVHRNSVALRPSKTSESMVNSPSHYITKGVECITAIQDSMSDLEFRGYLKGNCIKYLWRYDKKHRDQELQREDLLKARWYLDRLIADLQREDLFTPRWYLDRLIDFFKLNRATRR